MKINTLISHRINTSAQLTQVPFHYGIELDIRSDKGNLILHHDPFVEGENFEDFLKNYRHELIILNTKEEGLEGRLLDLMTQYGVKNYFFLDLSLPFLIKTIKQGVKDVAVRFSEYEPLEFVRKFEGKAMWVWVDCFTKNILDKEAYRYLKTHFKICIVSPELQGHPLEWINDFKSDFRDFEIDAVCTKRPDLWK